MNSRIATLSASLSLVLVTLSLLNLGANPTKAFPRSRSSDQTDDYLTGVLTKFDEANNDRQPVPTNEVEGLGGGVDLEDLLDNDRSSSSPMRDDRFKQLSFMLPSRGRQMSKRHICEYHGVCERCAKHTKSHEVYSQCCRNVEGRKWCNDFLNYEMGRK